ncbi:MAG: PDZ domain-containing protein [Verrucomicrobiota bacterium]
MKKMSKLLLVVGLLGIGFSPVASGDIRVEVKKGKEESQKAAQGLELEATGNAIVVKPSGGARKGTAETAPSGVGSAQKPGSGRGAGHLKPMPQGPRSGAPGMEKRVFIGVALVEVPPAVRAHLDVPAGAGIMVEQALPSSPAEKAGIQAHDIIVKLDDQIIVNGPQLQSLVQMKKKGDAVTLAVMRKGKERQVEVVLGEQELLKPMEIRDQQVLPSWQGAVPQGGTILRGGQFWRDTPVSPAPPANPGPGMEDHRRAMKNLEEHQAQLRKQNEEVRQRLEKAMEEHRRLIGQRGALRERLGLDDSDAPEDEDGEASEAAGGGFPVHVYADSHAVVIDGPNGKMEFKSSGGDGTLVIVGPDGEVVFDGELKVPAEMEDLPAKAAAILELMDVERLPFLGEMPVLDGGGEVEVEVDVDVEVQGESKGDRKKVEAEEVKERPLSKDQQRRLGNGGAVN